MSRFNSDDHAMQGQKPDTNRPSDDQMDEGDDCSVLTSPTPSDGQAVQVQKPDTNRPGDDHMNEWDGCSLSSSDAEDIESLCDSRSDDCIIQEIFQECHQERPKEDAQFIAAIDTTQPEDLDVVTTEDAQPPAIINSTQPQAEDLNVFTTKDTVGSSAPATGAAEERTSRLFEMKLLLLAKNTQKSRSSRRDMEIQLSEWKRFSAQLQLSTPVPVDLIPFLTNDPYKRQKMFREAGMVPGSMDITEAELEEFKTPTAVAATEEVTADDTAVSLRTPDDMEVDCLDGEHWEHVATDDEAQRKALASVRPMAVVSETVTDPPQGEMLAEVPNAADKEDSRLTVSAAAAELLTSMCHFGNELLRGWCLCGRETVEALRDRV
ncbi:hypothetical protein QBC35DRAFT_452331 [Podospora australis]|uniref:Uncharacterized protein n=1 Tax=Podospora australis TaxID=1536484 RepID=A0AAN6WTK9_9PEZI|nr:hypothetical protein QBC35DRAFT_452331 [Podospora australis]